MARVRVRGQGMEAQVIEDVRNVKDVRAKLKIAPDHDATSRGEPVDDKFELIDGDELIFAPRVNGGK